MATLKNITRVGADVRQIARLLQAKAPENHMLAYITPEEAQFLKDKGGSGMPDAETGVPTFAPVFDYGAGYGNTYTLIEPEDNPNPLQVRTDFPPVVAVTAGSPETNVDVGDSLSSPSSFNASQPFSSFDASKYAPIADTSFRGPPTPDFLPSADKAAIFGREGYGLPASTTELAPFDTAPSKTIGERYSDLAKYLGVKEDTLARMGLGGLQAVLGARQARQAREESQKAKEEQQKLAAPYRQQGAELQRQAQAGELTPVGQQQLRTVQAQAAQAASARGGVGAQQTAARVEAIRNQLLQQQSDYGLKLSGIGDQILLGSIRTGLEADRYVNQLATTYYTNIARTLAGAPTVVQYGVTQ
jgi:hypothetical protein